MTSMQKVNLQFRIEKGKSALVPPQGYYVEGYQELLEDMKVCMEELIVKKTLDAAANGETKNSVHIKFSEILEENHVVNIRFKNLKYNFEKDPQSAEKEKLLLTHMNTFRGYKDILTRRINVMEHMKLNNANLEILAQAQDLHHCLFNKLQLDATFGSYPFIEVIKLRLNEDLETYFERICGIGYYILSESVDHENSSFELKDMTICLAVNKMTK